MTDRCINTENDDRLERIFPFLSEKGHIISIVGAGGKTTLMYFLAEQYAVRGHDTLVTTTTHILRPSCFEAENAEEMKALWQSGHYAVMGKACGDNKLTAADDADIYTAMADSVIAEADGAKGLPLKAPESHEPVIYTESDIVIGTAGLDALGRPLKEACFRAERAAKLLRCDTDHIITAEDIALMLSSYEGQRKNTEGIRYYALLNKCDNEDLLKDALYIRELLNKNGVSDVIISALKEGKFYE